MELATHKLSVLLLDPTMTDQQFTQEILFLKGFPIHAILVLPYNVSRAKQLLAGSAIQIASFIDFPFGSGTKAKKAFETVQLYQKGANHLFATFANGQLEEINHEIYQCLEQLSFGYHQLALFLNTHQMDEQEKNQAVSLLFGLKPTMLLLGNDLTVEKALADMGMFATAKRQQTSIQVNVDTPTLLELELLFQAGADYVGINNGREILSLILERT